MASNSKITLTIAGDATGVQRALKQTEAAATQAGASVAKSSHQAGEGLVEMGRSARSTREILRGMGDVSMLVGGEEGQMATQALFAAGAIKDLGRGTGELVKSLGVAKIATGGVILAIAALGAGISAHIDHTNIMNEVNRTAADTVDTVTGSVQFLAQKVPGLSSVMDKARGVTRGWSDDAHGLTNELLSQTDAMKKLHEASLFMAPDTNPGGDAFADVGQIDVMLAEQATNVVSGADSGSSRSASAIRSGGSKVAKAVSDAQQAVKDKLQRWQDISDQFSTVAKGIQDSLGPKLAAGIASPLMLAKGTSVLDNLKQQLKDTLHLQSDLKKLSKMGLGNDLLESLTAGGLDSLPAADELLASGRGGVNAARKTAQQITNAGGSIAGADAARQFADSLKKPIKVTLEVGKGGDDVLDKWLQKALKTKGAKFYGLKAA